MYEKSEKLLLRIGKDFKWKNGKLSWDLVRIMNEKLLLRTSNDCEWKKLHLLWGFGGEYERIANNILWKISWRIGKDYEKIALIKK